MKKDKEKKEKKEKKQSTNDKLDILIGVMGKLVELQTAKNEEKSLDDGEKSDSDVKVEPERKKNSFDPKMEDETYPSAYMPPKFRKIVDEVLSPQFDARVVDFEDRTDFQFDVMVPEKYSSVSKSERDQGVKDIRTRIIPRAMGENGVREWCTLIRKNLARFYAQEGVKSPFTNVEE